MEKFTKLTGVAAPLPMINIDTDKIFPAVYADLWKERLPDARLVKIAKCGHSPLVEQTETALANVRAFLKEVSR